MNGGSLAVGGNAAIGDWGGTGTFTQIAGTHTVAGDLYLGYWSDRDGQYAVGTYTLSGGSLSVGRNAAIGDWGGFGTFTQTGGTHTVAGDLYLAYDSGASGTYILSGGSLAVSGNEDIGDWSGTGSFTQAAAPIRWAVTSSWAIIPALKAPTV